MWYDEVRNFVLNLNIKKNNLSFTKGPPILIIKIIIINIGTLLGIITRSYDIIGE